MKVTVKTPAPQRRPDARPAQRVAIPVPDRRRQALGQHGIQTLVAGSPRQLRQAMAQEAIQGGATAKASGRAVAQLGKYPPSTNPAHAAKIKKLEQIIDEVNRKIESVNASLKAAASAGKSPQRTFVTDNSFTPMNPATYIASMATTDTAPMTMPQSRTTAFSDLVKEAMNLGAKNKRTPEAQTATVLGPDNKDYVYMSGNTETGNKIIRPKTESTFGAFYIDKIRPLNVSRRATFLKKYVEKEVGGRNLKKRRLLLNALRNSEAFPKKNATQPADERQAELRRLVVRHVHKQNKRSSVRIWATHARKFAKAHGSYGVRVPVNTKKIHAESAILEELKRIKATLKDVGGTKVACLACQAYYTHEHEGHHLGDLTGYAWISSSSQAQLKSIIASITDAESYLHQIYSTLETRLATLKRYTGKNGDKTTSDLAVESDISDTDSEDESAMELIADDQEIQALADELDDSESEDDEDASASPVAIDE